MTDIASITLHLCPTHRDTIPAQTGRAVQAWFLDSLRILDPSLSAIIHDGSGQLKPFTVRGLYPTTDGELLTIAPQQIYTIRITCLHPDLSRIVLNAILPVWRRGINLHDQPFRVEQATVENVNYSAMLRRSADKSSRRLAFDFLTPTVFKRTGDLQMPLPLPEYVFGSLIDRWVRFAPAFPLHDDLRAWVQANVGIDSHNIRTHHVSLERANKGTFVGFTGFVTYHTQTSEMPFLNQLHTLAAYAIYAGVGAKTTIGLGQVQPGSVRR